MLGLSAFIKGLHRKSKTNAAMLLQCLHYVAAMLTAVTVSYLSTFNADFPNRRTARSSAAITAHVTKYECRRLEEELRRGAYEIFPCA